MLKEIEFCVFCHIYMYVAQLFNIHFKIFAYHSLKRGTMYGGVFGESTGKSVFGVKEF